MSKRIVITGATGLIGRKLASKLINRGDQIIVFSRNTLTAKSIIPSAKEYIDWNYLKPEMWRERLEGSDAVIHLAGSNLFAKRWNDNFKNVIIESRKTSTKNLVEAIKTCVKKPQVFISASGIGFYGNCGDDVLNENSMAGNDFLAEVCKVWENEAKQVESIGVRDVQVRTGLVLSEEDGALKQMLPAFKLFVGGPLGSGKQWASWLHIDDIVGIYIHSLDNTQINGAVNAASPNPVRMKEFAKVLGKVLHRPSLFPVPKFILRLVVGQAVNVVVASQRINVDKILNSGYNFKFDKLEDALKDLLNKKGLE